MTYIRKTTWNLYGFSSASNMILLPPTENTDVAAEEVVNRTTKLSAPPLSKTKRRELTCGIDYVRAIVHPYVLKDVDVLPLQSEAYQTDRVCATCQLVMYLNSCDKHEHACHISHFFSSLLMPT